MIAKGDTQGEATSGLVIQSLQTLQVFRAHPRLWRALRQHGCHLFNATMANDIFGNSPCSHQVLRVRACQELHLRLGEQLLEQRILQGCKR